MRARSSIAADGRGGSIGGVITGAFLAEGASVVDNKLNVSGAVFSGYRVGPDRKAQFALVLLTQAETDTSDRRVEVQLRPPTDDPPMNLEFELPEVALAGEIGFAFFNIEVRLPFDGRWVFVVTDGLQALSLPLEVGG
jgi:hypothetical protein